MRKNKKWLSIILMVFIVLAAGCEVQSDDMKKDIIMQDGLPEMEDPTAGKEEAILPDDEEKTENMRENLQDEEEKDAENAVNRKENTHEDLQDERVPDTADYSAF